MSDQLPNSEQDAESEEKRSVVQEAAAIGKYTLSLLKSILFVAPLVLVLIIVVLALLGPAVGNVFSNIVNSL